MATERGVCAYCGEYTQTQEEHVVPRGMAPKEMHDSCDWVIVRACAECNQGISADESDFRAFCVVTDAPGTTLVKDAQFHGPVSDNWRRPDNKGTGALRRLFEKLRKPDGSGVSWDDDPATLPNLMIAPGASEMRVMRKIIRGLYFHHYGPKRGFPQVLPEAQILVEPEFKPAWGFISQLHEMAEYHSMHPAVFSYCFAGCEQAGLEIPGLDSVWLLVAQKGAVFKAVVLSNTFPLVGDEGMVLRLLDAMTVVDIDD
jgi:hypothetical protein